MTVSVTRALPGGRHARTRGASACGVASAGHIRPTRKQRMAKRRTPEINNYVFIGDTHAGCQLSLLAPEGAQLDEGGTYRPSRFQRQLFALWREFWDRWVPDALGGEPFAVVHMGDGLDGVHHNSTTQISHNLNDQRLIALAVLRPVVQKCRGHFYQLRGTFAHVGESGEAEEGLARELGAIPDKDGRYARYELWKRCGPKIIHCAHHISATGVMQYESTAVHKELVESFAEAGRWRRSAPDLIVRAHRHRHIQTSIPTARGEAHAVVVPGWQGKTPWLYRIAGARQSEPQFGGVLARWSPKNHELFVRAKVWSLAPGDPE